MTGTAEEVEEAYRRHKVAQDLPRRLQEAGYPARAIKTLPSMKGPGLDAARAIALSDGTLVLLGDRGPGKTQIATYLAAQRIMDGKSAGRYVKALDLWGAIRSTWKPEAKESETDVIRRLAKYGFLVIDECQERGDTDADRQWCDRTLTLLIDKRYDAMLPTLMIANLTVAKYEEQMPRSIRSRVMETGGIKVCDWPSYRH